MAFKVAGNMKIHFNRVKIIYRFFKEHPLARRNKAAVLLRFIKWQITYRINPAPKIISFIEKSKLKIEPHMTGATGNIYVGLHDFEDMSFLLHFVEEDDVFCDIGSNVGVYTVLASAVKGARTFAIEPSPVVFKKLMENIKINNIYDRVTPVNKGVGAKKEMLSFTNDLDTVNHVVTQAVNESGIIKVEVLPLPEILQGSVPSLIKLDVEGFELMVLKGATDVLEHEKLQALIVELNGSGNRYNVADEQVDELLRSFGFFPVCYKPFLREIEKLDTFNKEMNTIYIRDLDVVSEKIKRARKFSVLGMSI